MSVINTRPLAGASGNQVTGYNLTNSLRFRGSTNAYLNRTPSSTATSSQKFTISLWVKLSLKITDTEAWVFDCYNQSFGMYFNSSSKLSLQLAGGAGYIVPTQVFRDPSAWYHVVIAVDTTQATASNRIKYYVNGTQVTSFAYSDYPAQNTSYNWNSSGNAHYIGTNSAATSRSFDGYITEFYSIDGQQVTPSSFGETDTITGVWKPKKYTGTYGTNGFYLKFEDNSASTAAAIGKDSSGNGNNWTPNNIGVAATSPYPPSTITGNDTVFNKQNMFDGSLSTPTTATTSSDNYITFTPVTPISYTSSVRVYCYAANGYLITNYYSLNGGSETTFVGGGSGFNGAAWITVASGSGTLTSIKIRITRDYPNQTAANVYAIEIDGVLLNNNVDSVLDVPTLTSATSANYATLNPLKNGGQALSNGNLNQVSTSDNTLCLATIGMTSGKYYWEFSAVTSGAAVVGLSTDSANLSNYLGATSSSWGYHQNALTYTNATSTSYGNSWTASDIIGVAFDATNGKLFFSKNGTWQSSGDPVAGTNPAYSSLTSGPYFPTVQANNTCTVSVNFGQQPFIYTPPTGYKALNTYNLPDSTIVAGNANMDVALYTGNGGTIDITYGFDPSFVWYKNRSRANTNHYVFDKVRGANNAIYTNLTDAENAQFPTYNTQSFITNGSRIVRTNGDHLNYSGDTYVAWGFKGNGAGSSNTAGSITSTVSVNAAAGFSIVTYTGTGGAATVGHGLGVAPSLVIVKGRSLTNTWWSVYHVSTGNTNATYLNSNTASSSSTASWNSTTPTSSVFSIGTSSDTNNSGTTYVAYCWAEVAGFSKFGSYVGNGSTDGPFVYTGFRPRFIMMKRTSSAGANWEMIDTARGPYNPNTAELYANQSSAEFVNSAQAVDINSNGWKIRTTDGGYNSSGSTYIYMAFAENPFKNSLAR
jgi:hypothetical protein